MQDRYHHNQVTCYIIVETPVTPLNSDPFQVTFQDPNLAQAHPIGPLQTLRPHSKATATVTFPLQYPQPPQKSIRGMCTLLCVFS